MSNLNNKIFSLIEMKREGSYWDYKEKYHSNNAKFIHDIICLANNLDNKDAYLIFGVSDNGEVKGIAGDENRKNQADIIDLLRNQKFAGRIPPFVKLETILYFDKEIDVLLIFKSNQEAIHKYTALKYIHGRGLQQFLEIITLMKNGFADGAYSRWRSLYELNIIASFISEYGEEIAEAYICLYL